MVVTTEPTAGTVCKVQPLSAQEVMVNVVVEPTITLVPGAEVTGVSVHLPSEQLVIVSLKVVLVVTTEPVPLVGTSVHLPSEQLVIVSPEVVLVVTAEPVLVQCSSVQTVEPTVEVVVAVPWVAEEEDKDVVKDEVKVPDDEEDEDEIEVSTDEEDEDEIEVSTDEEDDSDEVEAGVEETGTALDDEPPGLLMVEDKSNVWTSLLAKEPEGMMSKARVKSTE